MHSFYVNLARHAELKEERKKKTNFIAADAHDKKSTYIFFNSLPSVSKLRTFDD